MRERESRLHFLYCASEVLFPLPASLGSLIENLLRGKKKAFASRLDRKYLWHMIYIIKEDKRPEFTQLDTVRSGNVNSVSHLQLLC